MAALRIAVAAVAFGLSLGLQAAAGDWPTAMPAESGFPSDTGARIDALVAGGKLENLHAIVVARHGRLVLERYYTGTDYRYARPLGDVVFGPDVLHDVRSISKSVVGLLYGIALAEGKVPAVRSPLVDGFPYKDLRDEPERRRILVEHALSMTMGVAWDERRLYTDPRNSEIAMEWSSDRYRYALDRPILARPGEEWRYNGGATTLLGRLIEIGTGASLLDFAREHLFDPLDIEKVEWMSGSDGAPAAASGLRLTPRDLAKIGQLVLDEGRWGGRQVVPEEWIRQSLQPRAWSIMGLEYGFQWWLGRGWEDDLRFAAAFGNGGQRLFVVPQRGLVVVVMAGNYNQPGSGRLADRVMNDVIMPPLAGAQ